MDRDQMKDDIERAIAAASKSRVRVVGVPETSQNAVLFNRKLAETYGEQYLAPEIRWHRSGCGYPDRGCSCAVLDEGDRQMAAQVSVADYRERFPQIAEQWIGGPQEVRTGLTDDDRAAIVPSYHARSPQRSGLRFRIITSVALGLALLIAGLLLQAKWDAECAAEQPGTRWNGDTWLCEAAR